jgi:hypothetical protein
MSRLRRLDESLGAIGIVLMIWVVIAAVTFDDWRAKRRKAAPTGDTA